MKKFFILMLALGFSRGHTADPLPTIVVASKLDTEGNVLAEILAQIIESAGEAKVKRKFGLGGTGIVYEALRNGDIDLYPEYTGTMSNFVLNRPELVDEGEIERAIRPLKLSMSPTFGFNNTYGLALKEKRAEALNLRKLSELTPYKSLSGAFSPEFLNLNLPDLEKRYGFKIKDARAIEHSLSYEALDKEVVDVIDVYTTDAKISKMSLRVLEDDKNIFPKYNGMALVREDFEGKYPKTWSSLAQLGGKISNSTMQRLNSEAEIERRSFRDIAHSFLLSIGMKAQNENQEAFKYSFWKQEFPRLTVEHLSLVFLSLILAIIVALPLGVLSFKAKWMGQLVLAISGIFQTIPTLALFSFMIPFFGIGKKPSFIILFLFALLPIVRGTVVGLEALPTRLKEVSQTLGLKFLERLFFIELPMASPSILSGIKTSAVVNVGTATLAAVVGGGGYGVPILTGLALNDVQMIMRGAVPAAVLALLVHALFEWLDRCLIPRGLRL